MIALSEQVLTAVETDNNGFFWFSFSLFGVQLMIEGT